LDTKNFVKTGVSFGVGAIGGILDTVGTEQDAKNIAAAVAAGKKQNMLKQYGTYINYVIPAAEVILAAAEVVKGDTAVMLATQAGALAGAKVTRNLTMHPFGSKKNYTLAFSATPSAWSRDRMPARQIIYTPNSNPQPIQTGPVVPIVEPQSGSILSNL
jgi:hypothetical protein